LDIPYIAKCLRRELKCSAAKKRDERTDSDVLLLTGDKRVEIKSWLIKAEIAREDEIKFRG
jgi:translation initiation factor 1 (eIF-1/SUI1)